MVGANEYISFTLDGRLYGLDIRVVKEIHPNVMIVPVPRTPDPVRGLVNIRGQVVLVMDIAILFGRAPRPVTETSHIVILKTAAELRGVRALRSEVDAQAFGDKPGGFLVDQIGDVVRVDEDGLESTPCHFGEAIDRFVAGVANPDRELLIVLDAQALIRTTAPGPARSML